MSLRGARVPPGEPSPIWVPGAAGWWHLQHPPRRNAGCGHFPAWLVQGSGAARRELFLITSNSGFALNAWLHFWVIFCCVSPSPGVSSKVDVHDSSGNC